MINMLIEKLDNEYTQFINNMKNKSNEEIIDSTYEIVVKKEIKRNFEDMPLENFQTETLLKQDNLLDEFYKRWDVSPEKEDTYFYTALMSDIQRLTREQITPNNELLILLEELKMNLADNKAHSSDLYTFSAKDIEEIIEYLEQLEVIKENSETER